MIKYEKGPKRNPLDYKVKILDKNMLKPSRKTWSNIRLKHILLNHFLQYEMQVLGHYEAAIPLAKTKIHEGKKIAW